MRWGTTDIAAGEKKRAASAAGPYEKGERLARLQALLNEQQAAFQQSCVGRSFPVLVEKPGRHPGQMVGRSPYLQPVHLEADAGLAGRLVEVTVTGAAPHSLAGRLAA